MDDAENKAPPKRQRRRAPLTVKGLEALLTRVVDQLHKDARNRTQHDHGKSIKAAGVYDLTVAQMESGATLLEVQNWLAREHRVVVSLPTLCRMRQQVFGRRVGREVYRELDRIESCLNPIRNLGALVNRLDVRYGEHVKMEETLGKPVQGSAVEILGLMIKANQVLTETLEAAGVLSAPRKVQMEHGISRDTVAFLDKQKLLATAEHAIRVLKATNMAGDGADDANRDAPGT